MFLNLVAAPNICTECGTPKKHLAKICDKCGADMSKQGQVGMLYAIISYFYWFNLDVSQIIANLKITKQELASLQAKFQKVEEENKKITEQLKQALSKPAPKPESVKSEPKDQPSPRASIAVQTEPAKEPPKSDHLKPETIQPSPRNSVAIKHEPVKTDNKSPGKTGFYSTPKSFVPVINTDIRAANKAEPVKSEPLKSQAAASEPVKSETKDTSSPRTGGSFLGGRSALGPRYLKNIGTVDAEITTANPPKPNQLNFGKILSY